jgi:hypothetical protein
MELVETQHPAARQQFVETGGQGVGVLTVLEQAAVQMGEKPWKCTRFLGDRQRLKKPSSSQLLPRPTGPCRYRLRVGWPASRRWPSRDIAAIARAWPALRV